jgi:hypothetical protein
MIRKLLIAALFAIATLSTGRLVAALSSDTATETPQFQAGRAVFTNIKSWLAQVRPLASEVVFSKTLPSDNGDYYVALSQISPHRYALFVYSTRYHAMEHFGWGFGDAKGKPLTITNSGLITRQYQVPGQTGATTVTVPYGTDILFDGRCSGEVHLKIGLPTMDHHLQVVDTSFTMK